MFEAHRLDQALTQEELALRAGQGRNSYQAWTIGETRFPTLPAVLAYADALGLRFVVARKPRRDP